MTEAAFSKWKSILNSCFYNGYYETAKILRSLFLIKLNLKKDIYLGKIDVSFILRNGTSDLPAFRQIFMDHQYDFSIPKENVKIIVDGGCNIGLAAIYFASEYSDAKIIGVEPDEKNYDQALLNTKHHKNITVIKAGLWNKSCYLKTVPNPEYGEWGVSVVESDEKDIDSIKGISISQLMNDYNLPYIDILKLDVEGAEKEIFDSESSVWLQRTRVIIIELHDFFKPGCSLNFFKALTKSGINYSYSSRGENVVIINLDLAI